MPSTALVRFVVTLLLSLVVTVASAEEGSIFDPTRALLEEKYTQVPSSENAYEAAELLLDRGDPVAASRRVPKLEASDDEGRRLAARILLDLNEFERAQPLLESLDLEDPENRRSWYRWLFLIADLAAVDVLTGVHLQADPNSVVDRLAAGRLRFALVDPDGAEVHFTRALELATEAKDRRRALRGLSSVAYKRRDFDLSMKHLETAMEEPALDPDLLMNLNSTLIRLGRTDEAIEAVELAVVLAPYHERAHYSLGNGYARKNYTQLYEHYRANFADEAGREALEAADALLEAGDAAGARAAYESLREKNPQWADVLVRLGSLEFSQSRFRRARNFFEASLLICPEYGRAHNGIAKALEAERLAVEVHRAKYEADFAAKGMPAVPRIDELVVNWHSLSPRHQKQVALSVQPWERYLPVLIEGGLTYYIKPLYEILSETPGQKTLRDLRISYDSRLWDDVRGCGGYHTVTGIEDVERTVLNRYNTVLHELTHQVHGVLPTEKSRQIQELYRETKVRDEQSGDAFLSRYAGGSVWEYFAEGANSLASPRRDEYDTREIVLERLDEMDPELKALVVELEEAYDVAPCYPVAYVGRGYQELEHAKPEAAIESYRKALEVDSQEPKAIAALVYALQITDDDEESVEWAERGVSFHPDDGGLATTRASAMWHAGHGLDAALEKLATARESVREEDRYLVDLELGRLHWYAGHAAESKAAYDRVLDYQSDNPSGLWGRAGALALTGDWDEAWATYEEAVRHRTGVVDLRVDYARDLVRAGAMDAAREQIDAAILLDPTEPEVRALDAWWHLESGDPAKAREIAESTLGEAEWCSMARMVLAKAASELGQPEEARQVLAPLRERHDRDAPPRYVFRQKWGRYDEVETHPAVERELLAGLLQVPESEGASADL